MNLKETLSQVNNNDCSNFLTFFVKEVIMDTVKDVTVYPTPFVKPHCVLIVADATVLLINRRLAHTDVRLQKHAGMFCASHTLYG